MEKLSSRRSWWELVPAVLSTQIRTYLDCDVMGAKNIVLLDGVAEFVDLLEQVLFVVRFDSHAKSLNIVATAPHAGDAA